MTSRVVVGDIREGDVVSGKYRIDKILGMGGMGAVVAAHHLQLDERVAIKFLLTEAMGSPEAIKRFEREARAAVKIKSEHVVRVSDVGTLENNVPYMVMEYLQGSDLAEWLTRQGPLPVEQAADFVLQACDAIAEAHALGIIHRDLKPANLFVTRLLDGSLSVKVLDFGISKVTAFTPMITESDGAQALLEMTRTAALMGSPLYMSPEQMQSSKDVDSRTDVWALGVILYELLTGVSPFTGDTLPSVVLKINSSAPAPIATLRADVPKGLEQVVLRCLEKDRDRRFETVGELALALLPFAPKRSRALVERISAIIRAGGLSETSLRLPPSSDAQSEPLPGAGTAASWGRTDPGGPRSRAAALAAGAGLLVLGALGGVLLTRASERDSAARVQASSAAASLPPSTSGLTAPPEHGKIPAVGPVRPVEPTPEMKVVVSAEPPIHSLPASKVAEHPAGAARALAPKTTAPNRERSTAASTQAPLRTPKKPNCNPNYYLDALGEKHFKPECF